MGFRINTFPRGVRLRFPHAAIIACTCTCYMYMYNMYMYMYMYMYMCGPQSTV